MKLMSMQLCMLSINRDGLSLRWEDSSKGLQSSVWLHSEVGKEPSHDACLHMCRN